MPTVKFMQDFIYVPPENRRTAVKYLADRTYPNVRREAAAAAVDAGKGEIVSERNGPLRRKPARRHINQETDDGDLGAGHSEKSRALETPGAADSGQDGGQDRGRAGDERE